MFQSAIDLANNNGAASDYVCSRQRDLRALADEIGPVNEIGKGKTLGYATITRTQAGFAVQHRDVVVLCAGFVCAQAYILAKFW